MQIVVTFCRRDCAQWPPLLASLPECRPVAAAVMVTLHAHDSHVSGATDLTTAQDRDGDGTMGTGSYRTRRIVGTEYTAGSVLVRGGPAQTLD